MLVGYQGTRVLSLLTGNWMGETDCPRLFLIVLLYCMGGGGGDGNN